MYRECLLAIRQDADLFLNVGTPLDALKSGDSVVTRGGVVGSVQSVKDTTVSIRSLESKFEVEKYAIERVIKDKSDLKDNK